jgi:hypothetical protein
LETRSEEQHKVESLAPAEVGGRGESSAPAVWDAGPHLLFLANVGMRGALSLMLVVCAVYILSLLGTWGALAWLVVGVTSAGLAWVLLDDAFDIEGTVAREAALAAVFDPDPFGARAAAVRSYSDKFTRVHGCAPAGQAVLRQPGTDRPFRAHFASRNSSRNWYTKVALISLQRALRVVAAGLLAVIASQLYIVLAG